MFNTDTAHPDGASPTVTADLVCDDTGKWTFDGTEVTTVSCDYTATTSCTSCTADSVMLEAQETASGFVGLLPTSSVVTVAGGCNTITITCTSPDGDAVMELNDGATPFAPAPTLAATLVCDGAGAWQYTAGGVSLEVTKISCAYISPCTACEAGDITLDSGGYTDANDLLLKTQPTLGAITTTAAGCSSVIATCALPDGAVGDSFMEFNDAHIGSPPDLTQPITVDLTCNENGEWEYQFPTASLVVDKLFCSHLLACTSCPAVTTSAPQPLIGGLTRDGDGCATTTATCTAPTGGSSSLTFNGNIPYSGAAAPTVTIDLVCDDTGSWTADGVSLTDVKCVYT